MDQVSKAAFITAQAACANTRVAAMVEQNRIDQLAGRSPSYQPHDIEAVPDAFGLGHNAVLIYLQE